MEDSNAIEMFLESVKLTENRFLSQLGLVENINNSDEIKELQGLSNEVLEKIDSFNNEYFNFEFIPLKPIDNIPLEWFKVAEIAIKNQNGILNANTVKRLAADAYRQKLMQ